MDPFATLGISPSFDLDARAISERKVALSRELHPDRHVGRPASERRMALSKALEVNEAARLLNDPITRAEALLSSLGAPSLESERRAPSQAFLMDILELREDLRAAGRARDHARLDGLMQRVQERKGRTLHELSRAFSEADVHSLPWREEVSSWLSELRYLQRFFDEAEAFLDDMP